MHMFLHPIINLILGIPILLLANKNIVSYEMLIIILSGFLIDLDHLFADINKESIKDIKKLISYWWNVENKYEGKFQIFHSYEFLLLALILSFFNYWFIFIFIGLFLHWITDAATNIKITKSLEWTKDYSIIMKLLK